MRSVFARKHAPKYIGRINLHLHFYPVFWEFNEMIQFFRICKMFIPRLLMFLWNVMIFLESLNFFEDDIFLILEFINDEKFFRHSEFFPDIVLSTFTELFKFFKFSEIGRFKNYASGILQGRTSRNIELKIQVFNTFAVSNSKNFFVKLCYVNYCVTFQKISNKIFLLSWYLPVLHYRNVLGKLFPFF